MQEKEKIQQELSQLQTQCVRQYLESKLEAITTKEVLNDILQGFMQVNNVEFIQNVTENILEVKNDNKILKKELEFLRVTHSHEFEALKEKIVEEYRQANEQICQKQTKDLSQKVNSQLIQISDLQNKIKSLEKENKELASKCQQLVKANKILSQDEEEIRGKYSSVKLQSENLRNSLSKLEQNSSKFRMQCQKQLEYNKQQREKEISQICERFDTQRKNYQQKIQELQQKIKSINFQLAEEATTKQNEIINNLINELSQITEQKETMMIEFEQFKAQTFQQHQKYAQTIDNLQQLKQKQLTDLNSLELSHKYLQEQNEYLRQEIITFRNRYSALQTQKQKLKHQYDTFRQTSNKEIELLNMQKLNLQQQIKEQISLISQKYSKQIQLLEDQISTIARSKQETIVQSEQKDTNIQSLQRQINQLKQENQCMSTQFNFYFNQNEVHENQLKACEVEITKINQQCRAQIETLKKAHELNWNQLNQQLHEQKYQNKILSEINSKLTEDLAVEKDKQAMYQMYLQQNGHLKKQLNILASKGRHLFDKQQLKIGQGKQKFIYYIKKISLELSNLKEENKKLKQKVFKEVKQYHQYFQRNLTVLISKIKEESIKCSYCEHKKSFNTTYQSKKVPDLCFQKTIPKGSANNQSIASLKKSLRNIQHRYQSINQENKYYTEHIETIIKHA